MNQRDYESFHFFQGDELVLDDSRTKRAREKWVSYQENRNWLGDFYQWRHELYESFRIWQLMQYAKNIAWEWWSHKGAGAYPKEAKEASEVGIYTNIYREPTQEVWKEAWRVTEGVLLKMRDEIAQKGAKFFVVVLTNGVQVHPDVTVRTDFAKKLGVNDLFYPDNRLAIFCQKHGIPVLLLAPDFQEYATEHRVYLHGFAKGFRNTLGNGHWNQDGHRLAGQTIARWLCPQLN
jgi:hypothetical protein